MSFAPSLLGAPAAAMNRFRTLVRMPSIREESSASVRRSKPSITPPMPLLESLRGIDASAALAKSSVWDDRLGTARSAMKLGTLWVASPLTVRPRLSMSVVCRVSCPNDGQWLMLIAPV